MKPIEWPCPFLSLACLRARIAAPLAPAAVLLGCLGLPPAGAQEWGTAERPTRGLQVTSVSVSSSYYNVNAFDRQIFSPFATYGNNLPGGGSDVLTSASAAITWQLPRETSGLSLTYIPTYSSYAKNSKWNTFNQSVLLSAGRPIRMNSRLSMNVTVSADVQDYRFYMFSPGRLTDAVSAPATFEDLSAALAGGKVTPGSQLAAYLTGSPTAEAASRAVVYGDRMLSASAQAGLSYEWTPRLSLNVTFGMQRYQHLSSPQNDETDPAPFLVPQTTSGTVGANLSYRVSPSTSTGVEVTGTRAFSSLQDTYSTNSMAFVRHNITRRWFVSVHGGAGLYMPVNTTTIYTPPSGPQATTMVTTGFKTYAHTFAGSYQRLFADTYGVGGNATTAQFAWTWRVPRGDWWLNAGVGRQQFTSGEFADLVSWQGIAGVSRMLTSSLVAQVQYSYLTYSGPFAGNASSRLAQTGVRFTIAWMPRFNPI